MKKLIVTGKSLLNGKVKISGSKNAGLPIIISTLLASGQSTISNVPNITDIQTILKLFNYLGVKSFLKDSNLIIDNSKIKNRKINSNITKNSRAIILILGPLLLHFGSANISLPGGCKIGYRPIDLHINSLKAIGSNIKINNYNINANVNSKGLKGTFIDLPIASVGATQHIMITATLIKGNTIINNAAKEPEVIELASALKKMGANISGEGSSYIQIVGVTSLNPLIYNY